MSVELEPDRRLERPLSRDDYMEAFLRVLDREPITRPNWYLEKNLRKHSRSRGWNYHQVCRILRDRGYCAWKW